MLEIIISLALLTFLFWLGFHITGALLSAAIWLFIKQTADCSNTWMPWADPLYYNTVDSIGNKMFQVRI